MLSKWNQCLFQCDICGKTSNSRKGLMGHIMTSHGLGSRAYRDAHPDIEVNAEWFLCRICTTKVKFMKDPITVHLKAHGLGLDQYEARHMRAEDWPDHPQHDNDLEKEGAGPVEGDDAGSRGPSPLDREDVNQNDSASAAARAQNPWNRFIDRSKLSLVNKPRPEKFKSVRWLSG